MANAASSKSIIDFVRESERISGIGLPDDPAEWTRKGTERHVETAKIVASEGGNVIMVSLINTALTNNKHEWFRTGTEGGLRNIIPEGREIPGLVARLDRMIHEGVAQLSKSRGTVNKDKFAWQMHDMLICLHAFKEGNGRTARLLLNHLRIQLKLPWFIVHYDKSQEYYAKLDVYRRKKFPKDLEKLRKIVLEDKKAVA